jgi:cytochrome o ubiquinol oxidase subunit 2
VEQVGLSDATAIMPVATIFILLVIFVFAWWWIRIGNHRKHGDELECPIGRLVLWPVPAVLILLTGSVTVIGAYELDRQRSSATGAAPIEIEVIPLDRRWLFVYPKHGIASLNQLNLPEGVPIHFRMTSASMMNRVFVPQLDSQVQSTARVGMRREVHADPSLDIYGDTSTRSIAGGTAAMSFTVVFTSARQFETWVERTRSRASPLNPAIFALLGDSAGTSKAKFFSIADLSMFDWVPPSSNSRGGRRAQCGDGRSDYIFSCITTIAAFRSGRGG